MGYCLLGVINGSASLLDLEVGGEVSKIGPCDDLAAFKEPKGPLCVLLLVLGDLSEDGGESFFFSQALISEMKLPMNDNAVISG